MSGELQLQAGVFPATQWSLVERAKQSDLPARRAALATLLHRYLPALRAYLFTTRRFRPEQADDLLQGFVTDKVIEQDLLRQADQERGRLRSFLMVTLDRYVVSQHRLEAAQKRSPAGGMVALEAGGCHPVVMGDALAQFNVRWARELVAQAVERTKAECAAGGRGDLWRIFEARVVRPAMEGQAPVEYQNLVDELRLETPLQACALLTTAKRMFTRNLRAVAAEYAGDESAGAEAEIEDLRKILAGGRAQSGAGLRR